MNQPPDPGTPSPSRRPGRPALDLVVAVSAIFISAVSLVVAVAQGQTERDLVRSSSWPFLREIVANQFNDGRDAVIGVSNGGVGPAKLVSLEVFYEGRPVASPLDLLRRCCGLGDQAAISRQLPQGLSTSVADQTVLRPGEDNPVLVVHRLVEPHDVPDRFVASLLRIGFRACYCSVLDECWISDLRSLQTEVVRQCTPPAHPFDPNARS